MSTQKLKSVTNLFMTNGSRRPRKRIMVQNYALIWVDAAINENDPDCQRILRKLREVVKEVNIFNEAVQCIQYIDEMDDGKVFLISSGTVGQYLVPEIHAMRCVDTIYIYCGNQQKYERWAREWPKILGVYTSLKPICQSLRKVANQCDHDCIPMSFVPKRVETSDDHERPMDQLEPTYMYTLLFKEIILEIKDDDDDTAIKDLLAYCKDKNIPESELDDLKTNYHKNWAIWWYTCDIFLYSMLNKALRNLEMNVMIKMGFIIRKMHFELESLHQQQSNDFKKQFVVYRGQGLVPEDFQHLKNIKGGLLAFNCFLSTSFSKYVAIEFMNTNLQKYRENVGVLFVMNIDQTKMNHKQTPFALIDDCSAMKSEEEVLFSMHTVFRVNNLIQSIESKRRWEVQLTITNDNDPELGGLSQRLKQELFGSTPSQRLSHLLLKTGHPEEAELAYKALLKKASTESERADIYHMLALAADAQGKHTESIEFSQKCLDIYTKLLPKTHCLLADTNGNIGGAYQSLGDYSEALEYYEKALTIRKIALPPVHPDLATSYSNIGSVYSNMGHFWKALQYYEEDLNISKKALPQIHPDLATSYSNIGGVYKSLDNHSKALEYYKKALEIREKALPPTHCDLARSYSNIGGVYNNMGDYSKAFEYYWNDLEITRKSLSPNHPDLALSYNNVGDVYKNKGDYSNALKYYEIALDIREKALPINHLDLATSYNNIGSVYDSLGDYSKALEYYEKAQNV